MLRYLAAAAALKVFSANAPMRRLYRKIGNTFGQRGRLAVSDIDIRIERGNLLVDLCRTHGAVKAGDRILEIGTGWMHFYSLYLRLFHDIRVTALDIWDNRQFAALQAAASKLLAASDGKLAATSVRENLQKLLACKDFDEFYRTFGYDYVIEPTGTIAGFPDASFDFITSFHVLEHVPAHLVDKLARDMFEKLKPGACTIHQIGIDDHLSHYDPESSHKHYLKYSDGVWRTFFENEVQYFNRLQTSDWLSAFERAGFALVDSIAEVTNIDALKVNARFRGYPQSDLECTTLTLVYRKNLPG